MKTISLYDCDIRRQVGTDIYMQMLSNLFYKNDYIAIFCQGL